MVKRKGKGSIIIIITLSSLLLLSVSYIIFTNISITQDWNVKIDGELTVDETWFSGYWERHASYLTPNMSLEHPRDYIYIHTFNDDDFLYIFIDLPSDTTNDSAEEEWLFFSIITQPLQTLKIHTVNYQLNDSLYHNGWELFMYNYSVMDNDTGINQPIFEDLFGELDYNDTLPRAKQLNASDFDDWNMYIEKGFDITPYSQMKHAFYEIKIRIESISFIDNYGKLNGLGDRYYIGILGYGTLAGYYDDFYSAPAWFYPSDALSYFEFSKVDTSHTSDLDHHYTESTPLYDPIGDIIWW